MSCGLPPAEGPPGSATLAFSWPVRFPPAARYLGNSRLPLLLSAADVSYVYSRERVLGAQLTIAPAGEQDMSKSGQILTSIEVPVQSSYFVTVTLEKHCMRLKSLSDGSGENVDKKSLLNQGRLDGEMRRTWCILGAFLLRGGVEWDCP